MNEKDTKELTFMREQIKQRPINSKKLFRRTLMTVSFAMVFGLVACLIFVLLVPAFTKLLNPESATETVPITFPDDTVTDEIPPEDLFADGREIAEADEQEMMSLLKRYNFDALDFSEMHTSLRQLAVDASAALVSVTGVGSGVNWIDDLYETSDTVCGLIVADNGTETLILADISDLADADSLRVTFANQATVEGSLLIRDTVSSLGIVAVPNGRIGAETKEEIAVAKLGNSLFPSLTGSAAIAIGTPAGVMPSYVYGMITSNSRVLDVSDANYTLITTNMTGPSRVSGAIINTAGEVTGFFVPSLTEGYAPVESQLAAVGISSLKGLIEKLVNGSELSYLGIHGTEIPQDIRDANDLPQGAYVRRIDMDSPALEAGIQSGDIITRYGQADTATYAALVTAIREYSGSQSVNVTLLRQGPDGYNRMNISVTPRLSTITED